MEKGFTASLYLLSGLLIPTFVVLQVANAFSSNKHFQPEENNVILGVESETDSPGMVAADTTVCSQPSTALGKGTKSINLSLTGTYKIWSRMKAKGPGSNSYWLSIDGGCPINVGDLDTMTTNSWVWISYQIGLTENPIVQYLTSGTHTITVIGKEAGLKLDRMIFTQDLSCVPTNLGGNCLVAPTAVLTKAPTASPTAGVTNKLTPTQTPTQVLTPTPQSQSIFTVWEVDESNITTSQATITWKSNHPSTSWVEYGTSRENLSFKSPENSTLTKNHSVTIKGLSPKTEYYYRVYSTDSSGETRNSSAKNFTTKALQ